MKKRVAMLVSTLALIVVAGVAQAGTMLSVGSTDQFQVSDTGVITSGWIGIGTVPAGPLHVKSSGNTIASSGFTLEHTTVTDTKAPKAFIAPGFTFYRNNENTVAANNGLPRLNDTIGSFKYGTRGTTAILAQIDVRAEKAWTLTDTPTFVTFEVNPGGNVTNRTAMTIASSGTVSVNGGVRIYPYAPAIATNVTLPARPLCDATTQGTLWFTKTAGADTLTICADVGGLAWKTVTLQ